MRRVFNLGIGMVLIAPSKHFSKIRNILAECGEPKCTIIGEIKKTCSKSKNQKVIFT